MKRIAYVGLDVHKDSISIAVAEEDREPAKFLGQIPHDLSRLKRKLKELGADRRLVICYEAGPTGYGLHRRLVELGRHALEHPDAGHAAVEPDGRLDDDAPAEAFAAGALRIVGLLTGELADRLNLESRLIGRWRRRGLARVLADDQVGVVVAQGRDALDA